MPLASSAFLLSFRTTRTVQVFQVDARYLACQRVVAIKGQSPVGVDFHAVAMQVATQPFDPFDNTEAGEDVVQ